MTAPLIANLSQLKLTEINTLAYTVDQLQADVDARRAAIASLSVRSGTFDDLQASAEALNNSTRATLDEARGIDAAAHAIDATSDAATRRTGQIKAMLDQMTGRQAELLRQLVTLANLLENAHHHAQQQKALNRLIPDALLALLDRATEQCTHVIALALVAQDGCLIADAGLTVTHGHLLQARDAAGQLLGALGEGDDSVLGTLGRMQAHVQARQAAAQAASVNAGRQLDHARRECVAREARLGALKAGLAAMNA
jgi:hypothetical protein